LFVPWCLIYFGEAQGWKMAYIITGAVGFLWLFFWFALYNSPSKSKYIGKEDVDYIHADDDLAVHAAPSEDIAVKEKVSWWKLLRYPQTWAFFMGKFLTDGVWWFLLFWLPDYLKKQFHMDVHQIRWPIFIVYSISILGSTLGGNLPRMMINRGMPVHKARMRSMFIIALFPLTLLLTQYFGDKATFGDNASILALTVICIGAAAHQAWSANLFTTVSVMFPKKAVGSVIGIGGFAGGIGGVIIQLLSGGLNTHFKSHPQTAYLYMFSMCAVAYIIAWIIIKLLTSKPPVIEV
jgi:ACS family hexuronate transporter-like MFS transporter